MPDGNQNHHKGTNAMKTHTNAMDAKIEAVNAANSIIMEYAREMRLVISEKFIGKKIYTLDGFTKALKDAQVSAFKAIGEKYPQSQTWRERYNTSLYIRVKTWGHYCRPGWDYHVAEYYEKSFCLCEVAHGVAVPLAADAYHLVPENYPSAWTSEQVGQLMREHDAAVDAVREARSKLGPFAP
jgi:hypothetical protein